MFFKFNKNCIEENGYEGYRSFLFDVEMDVLYLYNIFVENNFIDLKILFLFFIYNNLGDFEINMISVCWILLDCGWEEEIVDDIY